MNHTKRRPRGVAFTLLLACALATSAYAGNTCDLIDGDPVTDNNGGSTASGFLAVACGLDNTANGPGALAYGRQNDADGLTTLAVGTGNTASGDMSAAMGFATIASGKGSIALARGAMPTTMLLWTTAKGPALLVTIRSLSAPAAPRRRKTA